MNGHHGEWQEMREQCAEVLWQKVSAPKLPVICRRLGLEVEKTEAVPMNSKRAYVHSLIDCMRNEDALTVARQIADEYNDFQLRETVARLEEGDALGYPRLLGESSSTFWMP
ncbi:hypothetical protein [Phaeobacter sp. B1627]|uniref:hypothetical protein n=1 Tax=Phaeobacter sp. B1627 TaxID=2583809 RepID=UPI00111AEA21|nr:hypothetical protein [Phaeobacter sp. B1627]TNJ38244.1 hypothetical protein FGE21_19790 [Phaeobacter sp. B1627]